MMVDGVCVGQAVQEVSMLTILIAPPPLCISEFSEELTLNAHKKLQETYEPRLR